MIGSNKPRVKITEGWALSDKLIENPYIKRIPGVQSSLCAEFKRMVFEDGVPVRPSRAHLPDMVAFTEAELRDMSHNSRASIMGVASSLRQAAFEKFPPLANPETAPSHVEALVESARIIPFQHPAEPIRQMAAEIPSEQQFQMKG